MRGSRHLWLIALALACLIGVLAWASPEHVLSALADPHYADSPQSAVRLFWKFLDERELKLAADLIAPDADSGSAQELAALRQLVYQDPLLSLQRVEILDGEKPHSLAARVFWHSPVKPLEPFAYSFELEQTSGGWRIRAIQRLGGFSRDGGGDLWTATGNQSAI